MTSEEVERRLPPAGKAPPILPTSGWTAPLTTFCAGVMGFLAVLTLVVALAADAVAAQWRADLAGVATVRLGTQQGDTGGRLEAVLEVLRTTPGISRVRVLSADEQRDLLVPWLGEGVDMADLPAPQLIDVELLGEGPDAEALQGRLDLTVEGAIYDDHSAWRAPLTAVAQGLETLAIGASLLVLLTVGAIVAFAARATLIANRHIVDTVRLVGAEDSFIARAFIGRLVVRAAAGGFGGTILAVAALALLPDTQMVDPELGLDLMPSTGALALVVVGVIVLTVLVTWAAAYGAVRVTLNRLP